MVALILGLKYTFYTRELFCRFEIGLYGSFTVNNRTLLSTYGNGNSNYAIRNCYFSRMLFNADEKRNINH